MSEEGTRLAVVRISYFIERRLDAKSPWVMWVESDDWDEFNARLSRDRKAAQYPDREWRVGKRTQTTEYLDE